MIGPLLLCMIHFKGGNFTLWDMMSYDEKYGPCQNFVSMILFGSLGPQRHNAGLVIWVKIVTQQEWETLKEWLFKNSLLIIKISYMCCSRLTELR